MDNRKEAFVKLVERLLDRDVVEISKDGIDVAAAIEYFNLIKTTDIVAKPKATLTTNGAKVLDFMRSNKDKYNNVFKSKEIAEGLLISSHAVSGCMRKLIAEGFVEKVGNDPVAYAITDKGVEVETSGLLGLSN